MIYSHIVTQQFVFTSEEDANAVVKHLDENPAFINALKAGSGISTIINFSAINNVELTARPLVLEEKALLAEAFGPDCIDI